MNRIFSPLILSIAIAACGGAPQERADTPIATPEQKAVAPLATRVDSIERLRDSLPQMLRLFAKLPGKAELVPVKDSVSWPDLVEVGYTILYDSSGRVLLHNAVPASDTGEWLAVATHVFDPDGRTIFYRFLISGFAPGCADVLYEGMHAYFDTTFATISENRSASDKRGKPIRMTGKCVSRLGRAIPPRARATELPGVLQEGGKALR